MKIYKTYILIIYYCIYNINYVIIKYKFMSDFWNNISRYPRFFISSMVGLILVILAPLKNLLKVPKLRFVLVLSFLVLITLLYFIIGNMTGL